MADTRTIVLEVDGVQHTLRSKDLSALDAQDFRAKVGVTLAAALNGPNDIDVLAGIVWLSRRRTERTLTYEQVAASFSYDTEVELVDERAAAAEVAGDPET